MNETSAKNRIRVVIVDDSMFMRTAIKKMLETDPEIQVIGTASNGVEAIRQVRELKPDLVTMDIKMPKMDGLTALKKIMAEQPLPILVISVLTESGAHETIEALSHGALDYIPKPLNRSSLDILRIQKELHAKVKLFTERGVFKSGATANKPTVDTVKALEVESTRDSTASQEKPVSEIRVVAIGASTGGPKALQQIIPFLPADFPCPVLIVQHMPAFFTKSLAERLNSMSQLPVREAEAGAVVKTGTVLIAPGEQHMTVVKNGSQREIRLSQSPKDLHHKPSVDVLMSSVAEVYGSHTLGVILTGMGRDGETGLSKIYHQQGLVFAQDEATSVIFGMPRACIERQIVDQVLPVEQIVEKIIASVQNSKSSHG